MTITRTAIERGVRQAINEQFVANGLPIPFKEVGVSTSGALREIELRESGSVITSGPSRTIELRESKRADLSTYEAEEQRLLKEVAANRTKAYLELQKSGEGAEMAKEAQREHKRNMKALAEAFVGSGKEHKKARKAFVNGRRG